MMITKHQVKSFVSNLHKNSLFVDQDGRSGSFFYHLLVFSYTQVHFQKVIIQCCFIFHPHVFSTWFLDAFYGLWWWRFYGRALKLHNFSLFFVFEWFTFFLIFLFNVVIDDASSFFNLVKLDLGILVVFLIEEWSLGCFSKSSLSSSNCSA